VAARERPINLGAAEMEQGFVTFLVLPVSLWRIGHVGSHARGPPLASRLSFERIGPGRMAARIGTVI